MTAKRQIAFIDPSLVDWKTLLAGLNEDIEVVILDPSTDGLLQIAESLRGTNSVSAIHIFSHGSSGEIMLGDAVLNSGNLEQYNAALATIGNALTETGDILLYGCNVAQGEAGQAFIAQFAAATGADVAASTDLTGNAALGGDWVLEAASGAVEASGLPAASFSGLLGLTISPVSYSYPGHSGGEFRNDSAFAALRADGSVVTWGYSYWGGDSSAVASQLDGTIDVTQVFSTQGAFAALRADGSVVTWGTSGGDSSAVASRIDGTIDVTQVSSTAAAFAALRADGSVVTWRDAGYGGDSSAVASRIDGTIDVTQVFSTEYAFAALRADGSLVTWGDSRYGGDSSAVASRIDGTIDVTQVFSTGRAFAALRADGSLVTWGYADDGGDSSAVASRIDGTIDVTQVSSTRTAFAALRADGSLVTWGHLLNGGDSSAVASQLDGTIDVTQVFSTQGAFAALRADGSVVTWGTSGGDSSAVASQIDGSIDVTQVFSAGDAFAALRADGSLVTWGSWGFGGDSSAVASQLDGTIDVTQVFSTAGAFAALRADGSLVTWGGTVYGGDSSAVASRIDGSIDVTQVFSTVDAFAALRADGSVVTWGYSPDGGDSSAVASQIDGTIDVVWMADPFHNDVYMASNPVDDYAGSTATTGTVSVGGSKSGNIETADDTDWFKVTLTAGTTYRFDVLGADTGNGTLLNPFMRVRDSAGTSLVFDDDSGIGLDSQITYTPTSSGTYFVSAGSSTSSGTGTYLVTATDVSPVITDDYAGSTATTGTVSVGGSKSGNIETADDTDWFKVTLTAGTTYRFDVLGADTGNGTLLNPFMRVRDSAGTSLVFDDDSGIGLDSQITYTPTSSGTYFVSAGSSTSSGTGTYLVTATDVSPVITDDYAGSTATTGTVSVGGSKSGNIETADDTDWFKVTLTAGTTYRFDVLGADTGNGTLLNPFMRVRDSAGTSLVFDDDSGIGLDSQITYTPTSSGTYFVSAGSSTSSGTGTYLVTATDVSPVITDDYAGSTATTGTVSVGGSKSGNIETADDTDWFKVALTAGTTYRFDVLGADTGNGTLLNPFMRVRDSAGTSLVFDDDSGIGLDSQITYTPTSSGTYFVSAGSSTSSGTGTYLVTATDVSPVITDDYAGSTATTGTVSVGGSKSGNIETADDTDWFKVTLTAGTTYRFDVLGADTGNGTLLNPFMRVRDSAGTSLVFDDDSGIGLDSQITYTPTSSGTYFVSAGSSTSSGTGTYLVTATDVSPVITDDYAGSTATTGTVSVGGSKSGNIETADDTDWFKVTLTAGTTYRFDVLGADTGNGTLLNPFMRVRDSAGTSLVFDDDSGIGLDSQITYTPTSSGTYFVSAGSSTSSGTGTYLVTATDVTPVNDADTVREGTDTTTVLAVGATVNGVINAEPISGDGVTSDGAGGYVDKDWYQVTLDKGTIYTFSGSTGSITTGLLDITLYGQNGTPINAPVEGAHPSFTFDTTSQTGSAQTYYLAVSAAGANPAWKTATGDYSISLIKQPIGGPNTKDIKVEFSTASWTQQADGQFTAAGNATIGLSSDVGSLLRIEGGNYTLTENTLNISGARVYSIAGGMEYALFTGSFSLSLDDPTGIINETQGLFQLAGLGTEFTAMHLLPGEVRVTAAFNLPQQLLGSTLGLTGQTVVFKQGGPQLGLSGSIDLANLLAVGAEPAAFHLLGKIGLSAEKLELSYDAFDDKLALSGDVSLLNYPNPDTSQGSSPILSLSDAGIGIQHGVAFAKGTIKSNGFDFAGGWGLSDLKLTFDSTQDEGSGTAKLTVPLARIPDVSGTVDFSTSPEFAVTGFALEFSSDVGIPIGTTGVNLRSLGGGASNLWNATAPIVWKGSIGLDWLHKLLYAKFTGESDLKESVSGDVKGTFLGENTGFVEFDGNGELNWIDQTFRAAGSVTVINDLIKGSASIDASNFTVPLVAAKGTAEFSFSGVDLSGNLSLKLSADGNPENDYAAAWAVIDNPLWEIVPFAPETITCGLRVDLDGSFDLREDVHVFGAQEVPLYASWIVDSTVKDLTVFVNWEQAATSTVQTRVVVYDDLGKTKVREIINEADYLTHGIAVVDAWSNSFAKVIYIAAPNAGVWDVEVVNNAGLGQINYSATTSLVEDTLKLIAASVSANQIQVDYTVTGPLEKAGLTFFADTNSSGFDGIPIRAIDISGASGKFIWDISGLKDGQYWIYAMLEDGQRVPVGDYADNAIQLVSRIEGTDAADILSVGLGTRGYTILGLAGNDRLTGGAGNDTMDGGSGIDTANYIESRATFQITWTSAGYSIFGASNGTDALINIERLQFTDKSLAFDLDGNAGQVYRLYQAAFDRVPDQGGLGYWINEIDRGTGLSQAATGFINSAEFKALYGNNPSNSEFVTLIYDNVLHRTPDAGGYSYWMEQLSSGMTRENVLIGFSESTENKVALMAFSMDGNMGKDYRLYQAAFDRKPDVSGLDYWYHQMNSGVTLQQVASGFINSAEFKALYGNNPSNAELVTLLYDNVLHRAPDTGGFNYWINELDHGTSREDVLIGFSESLENQLSLVGIVQTGIEFV